MPCLVFSRPLRLRVSAVVQASGWQRQESRTFDPETAANTRASQSSYSAFLVTVPCPTVVLRRRRGSGSSVMLTLALPSVFASPSGGGGSRPTWAKLTARLASFESELEGGRGRALRAGKCLFGAVTGARKPFEPTCARSRCTFLIDVWTPRPPLTYCPKRAQMASETPQILLERIDSFGIADCTAEAIFCASCTGTIASASEALFLSPH